MQSYFAAPTKTRLNSIHYFIMKIPNKQELQQIAFNHSSDIDFRDFINIYKKCTAKPYSFLVIDSTLASDNLFYVSEIIFQKEYKKRIVTIDDKIRDEKLQPDINRETAKISALSSGKINKYEYLTGEEILPSNGRQIIEQTDFAYSLLEKALEKQTEKQVGALKSLKPSNKKDELKQSEGIFLQNLINNLIRAKLKEIVSLQYNIKTNELYYN